MNCNYIVIEGHKGDTFRLVDVHADPSWSNVLAVEHHHTASGILLSVVNHREKTFEQRRAELVKQFKKEK